jgi:hypothetical protein
MPQRVRNLEAKGSAADFTIEQSGMEVTVKAGSFSFFGQDYELEEDEVFTATSRPGYTTVDFTVVKHRDTGVVSVMADELVAGEGDASINFDETDYAPLFTLCNFTVPPDSEDLDAVVIGKIVVVPPPPKPTARG